MSKAHVALCLVWALVLAVPAVAQEEAPGLMARITFWTTTGDIDAFETGLAAHNDFHKAKNDTNALFTWQIVTGKRTGQYVRGSFGHHWADFDEAPEWIEADEADSSENLDPYIGNAVPMIWKAMPGISRAGDASGGPAAMARVIYFHVRSGMQGGFMRAISAIHEAATKSSWPQDYAWYEIVDGGRIPTFALVLPADNWAGFAEPSPTLPEMMVAQEGEEGTAKIIGVLSETVESEWSETAVLREDLSYIPGSGM